MLARLGWTPLLALVVLTAGATPISPVHSSMYAAAEPLRFVTAEEGNTARYRVREQLLHHDLWSDAIGNTAGVTGTLVIGADGKVVATDSKFVVDVKPLKSDQSRRDRYVQTHILDTDKFPTVTLVPTDVGGLHLPLPSSGALSFQLMGNLTVHGATRPTTWHVTATVDGQQISGTAATAFTFVDFGLKQPSVPVVLSVADTIKLEYDFVLVRK